MSKGIIVNGMQCEGCEEVIESALEDVDGVVEADADHEADAVRFNLSGDPNIDRITEAVDFAGYEAEVPHSEEDSGEEEADTHEGDE